MLGHLHDLVAGTHSAGRLDFQVFFGDSKLAIEGFGINGLFDPVFFLPSAFFDTVRTGLEKTIFEFKNHSKSKS